MIPKRVNLPCKTVMYASCRFWSGHQCWWIFLPWYLEAEHRVEWVLVNETEQNSLTYSSYFIGAWAIFLQDSQVLFNILISVIYNIAVKKCILYSTV